MDPHAGLVNPGGPAARVLILSTERGAGSGAYRVLEYFLSAAPALRERLVVVAPPESGILRHAEALGTARMAWPARHDTLLGNLAAARRLRASSDIAVVHAWHSRGYESALLLARRLGARATATLHDHPVDCAHSLPRLRLMRFFARRMDALVSVSRALARDWLPFAGKAPVITIPNGIPDVALRPRPASDRIRLGFAGLYCAELKGWGTVRTWIRQSLRENWPVTWSLFGLPRNNPALAGEVQALSADLPPGFLRVEGFVPAPEIFSGIDLLLHPSVRFDSYPTLLLEAAGAGIPVFSSDAGGSGEIVRDGETGVLFPMAESSTAASRLRRLLEDPAGLARMGAAARAGFLERHLPAAMVDGYAGFWNRFLPPGCPLTPGSGPLRTSAPAAP